MRVHTSMRFQRACENGSMNGSLFPYAVTGILKASYFEGELFYSETMGAREPERRVDIVCGVAVSWCLNQAILSRVSVYRAAPSGESEHLGFA